MTFIHDDFLLTNKFAKQLYDDYAKDLPIIDYHCHLPPEDIAKDRNFENITQIWLNGDHYKWRALRTLGVSEKYLTGNEVPLVRCGACVDFDNHVGPVGNHIRWWTRGRANPIFQSVGAHKTWVWRVADGPDWIDDHTSIGWLAVANSR